MRIFTRHITCSIIISALALIALCGCSATCPGSLECGFIDPADEYKPWAYWWWLDSYATRDGITRDLEAMKQQGIAGALIFDAGEGKGSPVGPLFMSDEWRALYKHAVSEADRLGIVLGINLCNGWDMGGTWVEPEDASKTLVWSVTRLEGPGSVNKKIVRPEIWEGDFYRDIAVLAYPDKGQSMDKSAIKNWELKAARPFAFCPPERFFEIGDTTENEVDARREEIINLTDKMDETGQLQWAAPEGQWIVLRMGYALLGARTKAVSPGSQGLEIDFFSKKALDMHWANTGAILVSDAGPYAGSTFKYIHEDSYEVCGPNHLQQNWTPGFEQEFIARRGYDPTPYYPVLTGRIVDSREISNRFLWDYRRTIGDLFYEHHYKPMQELAHENGLGTHPESGGPFWTYLDALQVLSANDIPMGEFWKRVPEEPGGKITWEDNYIVSDTVRQAASAAHIYGKPVCQAEAYTSMGPNWEEDFYDLKDIGDNAFCAGLTRNVLCFYVHQPDEQAKPGYQWEFAGTHFDRHVTWWPMIHAWLKYLSRCQYMLRQGQYVADVLYYYGEDVPNYVPAREFLRPVLPDGYECDMANTDVLMNRLKVKDGRLLLPDGMSYRILVLQERSTYGPEVLERIRELVKAGATVVGPKPIRAPGLSDYPQRDTRMKQLADELWGDIDGESVTENSCGQGRVIWGRPLDGVLSGDHCRPDFTCTTNKNIKKPVKYIHRSMPGADIYFVSNQSDDPFEAECTFRVIGRQPEIWDAVTGQHRDARQYTQCDDSTSVPLEFAPRQSWFVVFRKPSDQKHSQGSNFPKVVESETIDGPWTVHFDPKWGGPESIVFEQLSDWSEHAIEGIKYYSGKATYEKTFELPESIKNTGDRLYLDLGRVENVAQARLNGKDLGVVWTAPWRVDMTEAAQAGDNRLEIDVINLWPNRLIGDAALPEAERRTVTNVKKFKADSPLMPSGLLGPVTLQAARWDQ